MQPKETIEKITVQNTDYVDAKKIANLFNDYFIDTVKDGCRNPNSTSLGSINNLESSIFLNPTSKQEILKLIGQLKNTQAVGYDDISTKVLKDCSEEIADPISHIINLSFGQGVFPEKPNSTIIDQ